MSAVETKTPRWVKILLVLSLAINLGGVGLLAGAALNNAPRSGGLNSGVPIDGLRLIQRALPEEERGALRKELRSRHQALGQVRRDMRSLRGEFLTALMAQPFVAEDLDAVFRKQGSLFQAAGTEIREALLVRITQMTDDERAAFAEALVREDRKGHRRPRKP